MSSKSVILTWNFFIGTTNELVQFKAVLADNEELRNISYKVRYSVFCKAIFPGDNVRFPPENYKNEMETDEYDKNSYHIIVFLIRGKQSRPVGVMRLIKCEEGYFMENEVFSGKKFVFPDTYNGNKVYLSDTFEAGRWCGHPIQIKELGLRVLVSMMLGEAALLLSKRLGRKYFICGIDHDAANRLRKNGWILDCLMSGIHNYHGDYSEVCIIPLGEYNQPCRKSIPIKKNNDRRGV